MKRSHDSSHPWVKESPSSGASLAGVVDFGPPVPTSSIYVHVPFCRDRCTYCAFATIPDDPAAHASLVEGLRQEMLSLDPLPQLDTLYLGGGTPGLLSPANLAVLIRGALAMAVTAKPVEVTLEVNPVNVTPENLLAWEDLGVTRLSLGVQTFRDDILRWLARRHDGDHARRALQLIAEGWGGTWSADLLVGWRGSDDGDVSRDTCEILAYSPPHVSVYSLTIEPGTPLGIMAQRDPNVIANNHQMHMFDGTWSAILAEGGLERYEVSNFAKAGHRSVHNEGYWKNLDYLGIGPGASGSVHPYRWTNERDPDRYLRLIEDGFSPRSHCERVTPVDRLLESLAIGLRTADGISLAEFEARFGPSCRPLLASSTAPLEERGFLEGDQQGRLRLSSRHLPKADRIITELVRSLWLAESHEP